MKIFFLTIILLVVPVFASETNFKKAVDNGNYEQLWQVIKQNNYNVPEGVLKYAHNKYISDHKRIRLLLNIYNKLPMHFCAHTLSPEDHEYIHLLIVEFKGDQTKMKKFVNGQLLAIATKRNHV